MAAFRKFEDILAWHKSEELNKTHLSGNNKRRILERL